LVATLETLPPRHSRPSKFLLSVVVPCFNEEDVISLTYQRLIEVLGNRDFRLEIVFVDDGSTDRTPEIMANFSKDDTRVKAVLLSRNFGHQAALLLDWTMPTAMPWPSSMRTCRIPPRSSSR